MKSYIGIDWSEERHDVRIHNEAGACVGRFSVPHSMDGFRKLAARLRKVNAEPSSCIVGIETQHNLLVDFVSRCGFKLYIVAPGRVSHNRGRYQASQAKDDDRDAFVLAEVLRTDQQRLIAWQADSGLVQQLRHRLSFVDDLTLSIVAQHNRLRANLLRYYPQALAAFPNLQTDIALQFLEAYPGPSRVSELSYETFLAFCKQQRYTHHHLLPAKFHQLEQEMLLLEASLQQAHQETTQALAAQLRLLRQQKKKALKDVETLFAQHEDAFIFASIPGTGQLLAPKLLVMFGDQRTRYPTPHLLPTIAGTAPVTKQSGKSRVVLFRTACNRGYRQTAQQVARCSCRKSVWATAYFQQAKARGLSNSHAYRCLANRWLRIIWTLWQRREAYDEARHLRDVHIHRRHQGR